MGILSRLRNFKHRSDDYDDVRSHVLGDYPAPPPVMQEPMPIEPRRALPPVYPQGYQEMPYPERSPIDVPAGLELPEAQRPEMQRGDRRDYDIIDRLSIIEAQLAAIRSQTETINERLKNMETRLPRRY